MITVGIYTKVLVIGNKNHITDVMNHALAKPFDLDHIINCINSLT